MNLLTRVNLFQCAVRVFLRWVESMRGRLPKEGNHGGSKLATACVAAHKKVANAII